MPFIAARDGTQLHYTDWGSGPPVVLIHGWPLSSEMWEYQRPALGEAGLRTVAYDRRGFGKSDQPWEGYDYDTFADDLAAVLEGLDLTGVTLVGFSMGGGEVARYLSRHGAGRVNKAVFIGAVTPYLLDSAPRSGFDEMVEGLRKDRAHFLAGFGKDKFMASGLMHRNASPEVLAQTLAMALPASPWATIRCVRAFSETDFRADLPKVSVPSLFIHGTHDLTVPVEISSRKAVELVPGARLVEYDGAPHGLFYTDAERLNEHLVGFVRG